MICGRAYVNAVRVNISLAQFQTAQDMAVGGKELANVWQGEGMQVDEQVVHVSETGDIQGLDLSARSAMVLVGSWHS